MVCCLYAPEWYSLLVFCAIGSKTDHSLPRLQAKDLNFAHCGQTKCGFANATVPVEGNDTGGWIEWTIENFFRKPQNLSPFLAAAKELCCHRRSSRSSTQCMKRFYSIDLPRVPFRLNRAQLLKGKLFQCLSLNALIHENALILF